MTADKTNTGPPQSQAEAVLTTRNLQNVSELDLVGLDAFLSWSLGIHQGEDGKIEVATDDSVQEIREHVKAHVEALLNKCLAAWACDPSDVGIRLTLTGMDKSTMSLLCTFEHLKAKKQEPSA